MRSLVLNRFAIYFVIIVLTALSINGLILVHVLNLHTKTLAVQQIRQDSLQITQDIQQETSALSRMVRAYTTSANTKYLTYYYDIIDIRQGKKALPEEYDTTYWAKVIAGELEHIMPIDRSGVSLIERMQAHGFSQEEFASVDRVLKCADRLYELDQIAFAATQGLYDPERKAFVDDGKPQRQFANQFVYSYQYLQRESELLLEVQNFVKLTDDRTREAVRTVSLQLRQSIFAAVVILGITVVIVLFAMGVIRKMVLAPMKNLMKSALELGSGDYNKRADTRHGVHELQALGQTFNAMAQNIQEDILQREQIQCALEVATIKADESTKTKSLFLANMSHEIRTPMNAIIGMTYLALNTDLNERQRDYVSKIQNASQSLLGIINDILDFSKIEAGKLQLDHVAFRLEEVVNNTLTLLRQRAVEKGLELLLNINNPQLLGDSGTYWGDPLRLGQILTNLLSNAVKFTNHGYVKISVEELCRHENRCELRFCVEDTGIGMTQTQLKQLFQEFSQVDGTATRKQGGTGLGLSISKRLVTQMGGQLSVTSKPHKGSQFTCVLTFQAFAQAAHLDFPCQGLKALIVDDHQLARTVLRTLLGHFGIESVEADSGEAALGILAQPGSCFDFLFIDWVMPGMNGEELIAAIRKRPVLAASVIVVVSAYDLERIHNLCGEQDVCHFLPKPVLPIELRKLFWETRHPHLADEKTTLLPGMTQLDGMRVLLVEDNLINQQVTSELLAFSGVAVDIVHNGLEAVDRISLHPDSYYHAVLMDIQMPVMDGYEATRILRSQTRYKDLPIIAMTAHAMVEEQQRCKALGMNAHIAKPIEPIILHRALAAYYIPSDTPTSQATAALGRAVSPGVQDCNLLPDHIPGIDLDMGLSLCVNKPELYSKVLQGFAEKYDNFAVTLQQLLDREEWEEIFILSHTFKGLAGTIGAHGLHELAIQIEKGAKAHTRQIEVLIGGLAEQLSGAVEAIKRHFAEASGPATMLITEPAAIPNVTLLVGQLRQLLQESDSEAQNFWKEHEATLKKGLQPAACKAISQAIAHFQYQDALALLPSEL